MNYEYIDELAEELVELDYIIKLCDDYIAPLDDMTYGTGIHRYQYACTLIGSAIGDIYLAQQVLLDLYLIKRYELRQLLDNMGDIFEE